MEIVKDVLIYLLSFYLLLLIGRLIISWIQAFSRSWTPTGLLLVIAEGVSQPPIPR